MKLIFSTAYDEIVFKNTFEANVKYIGTLGLLNILERELGLYHISPKEQDRLSCYKKCIEKCKSNTSFYVNSFNNDDLNVTKILLKYRDELVFSGWNPKLPQLPSRLKDLAIIEREFIKEDLYLGEADQWQKVITELNSIHISELNIREIEIQDPVDYLHPTIRKICNKLKPLIRESWKLNENYVDKNNLTKIKKSLVKSLKPDSKIEKVHLQNHKDDNSITLLKFNNEQELNDAMAFYANKEGHLFINNDNANFDFSLVSLNKNAAGSSQVRANPQIIQLFKLIIPCFSNELNIETLLSLLQLPYSPVPSKLTYKLAKSLIRKPGIGNKDWSAIINCYTGDLDKKDLTDQEIKLLEQFDTKSASDEELEKRKKIVKLFLTFNNQDEKESLEKAIKLLNHISKWAEERIKEGVPLEINEQFSYLINLAESAIIEIVNVEKISEVEKVIHSIYNSKKSKNFFKQTNSVEVISSVEHLAAPCNKTVIWLDFYNNPFTISNMKFLLSEEIEYLKKLEAFYPEEDQINLKSYQWLRGLLNCKNNLILCYLSEGANIEKHPLLIRLESSTDNLAESIEIDVKKWEDLNILKEWSFNIEKDGIEAIPITLPKPVEYFESKLLKKIEPREKESASSIEKFVQYPFDWVMQYIANFSNYEGLKLPDGNLLKGNIAHKIVENLFNNGLDKAVGNLIITANEFEQQFSKVVEQEGAVLLQAENKFDLSDFKFRLQKALNTLVDIINQNKFKIVGCEKKFGVDKNCVIEEALGNVTGSIDLLLEYENGKPFIIDLKWTVNDKKYKEYLEKGNALQLALYTAAIENKELSKTGYFLLNQNKLMTSANINGSSVEIIPEKFSNQAVLDKLRKSLEYRWEELKKGKVEMGETFALKELDYHENDGLVISLPKKGNSNNKKENPYTGFDLFKGNLN